MESHRALYLVGQSLEEHPHGLRHDLYRKLWFNYRTTCKKIRTTEATTKATASTASTSAHFVCVGREELEGEESCYNNLDAAVGVSEERQIQARFKVCSRRT